MSLKTKFSIRDNHLTGEPVVSARVVGMQNMDFDEFCDYLSQDSSVGAADVAAVMKQLERKLPLILGMNVKVQISQGGITVRPAVRGSITQRALRAKLQAKADAGEEVDVNRRLTTSDLTTKDLKAFVLIEFSKKFNADFANIAKFQRVADSYSETVIEEEGDGDDGADAGAGSDTNGSGNADSGTNGGDSTNPSDDVHVDDDGGFAGGF